MLCVLPTKQSSVHDIRSVLHAIQSGAPSTANASIALRVARRIDEPSTQLRTIALSAGARVAHPRPASQLRARIARTTGGTFPPGLLNADRFKRFRPTGPLLALTIPAASTAGTLRACTRVSGKCEPALVLRLHRSCRHTRTPSPHNPPDGVPRPSRPDSRDFRLERARAAWARSAHPLPAAPLSSHRGRAGLEPHNRPVHPPMH